MANKKKAKRGNTEAARRIWLAGIGAYGRAFTEAQEALKDMTGETSRVFDDLVQKGEFIEMAVGEKSKEIMEKAKVPEFAMPDFDFNVDDRIAKMRSRLMRGEEVAEDIISLGDRLDTIEAKLDAVLAALAPMKAPSANAAAKKRAATKRAPAKKTTPKTTK